MFKVSKGKQGNVSGGDHRYLGQPVRRLFMNSTPYKWKCSIDVIYLFNYWKDQAWQPLHYNPSCSQGYEVYIYTLLGTVGPWSLSSHKDRHYGVVQPHLMLIDLAIIFLMHPLSALLNELPYSKWELIMKWVDFSPCFSADGKAKVGINPKGMN